MADEWSGCSDNDEPDTAGMDAVEPAKEEDVTSCSTATATATKRTQNKKGKKKSRKRGGKK
jgi:hypothetical protein